MPFPGPPALKLPPPPKRDCKTQKAIKSGSETETPKNKIIQKI